MRHPWYKHPRDGGWDSSFFTDVSFFGRRGANAKDDDVSTSWIRG
jgi:hypothetical protein